MQTDYIVVVLTVMATLLAGLGGSIYLSDSRNRINRTFAFFGFGLAGWTLAIIGFRVGSDHAAVKSWMKAAYAVAFFCGVTFWFFAKALQGRVSFSRRALALHWTLFVLYTAALLGTDLLVRDWSYLPDGTKTVEISTFGWWMYAVYFLSYFLGGNLTLLSIYRKSSGLFRSQLRWLVVGVFFGGEIFGVFFNLLLPSPIAAEWHYIWTGPLLAAVFIVPFIAYGIYKHHLLNVKIVAAETLVFSLLILLLLNIFDARDANGLIYGGFVFAGSAIFGALLVRSVLQEVRRREEIQRLASELSATNKRLRLLDDLKSTMVSIASHQIRGPLGGIRGYMTMFRDGDLGPLTDKQKEIMTLNLNVTTRLLNAVETFLDITKLEAGKLALRKEVLPLDEAVADVVEEFRLPAKMKGLRLDFEIACNRPTWVEFDPEKIKHVIFNLIDNALKYTEQGKIDVRVRCDGHEAVFEVVDTGMGIRSEDVLRLFGKYERGELVIDRGGSGLGLYVVKMLTEMQGGRVWATSPGVGKGATFSVALPMARSFDPPAAPLVQ